MSSSSWAKSALILASPSFTGSWITENTVEWRWWKLQVHEWGKNEKQEGRVKYLELHRADFIQDLSQVFADHGPSDLVVALRCGLHRMAGHVVEGDHVWEDTDGFVEGAEPADRHNNIWISRGNEILSLLVFSDDKIDDILFLNSYRKCFSDWESQTLTLLLVSLYNFAYLLQNQGSIYNKCILDDCKCKHLKKERPVSPTI